MTLVIQKIQEKGKYSPVAMMWNDAIVKSPMMAIQAYLSNQIDTEIIGLGINGTELKFWAFDTHFKIVENDLMPDWECPQDIARKIKKFEQLITSRLNEVYPEIYISVTL